MEQQPNPYAPDPVVPPQQPYLPMPHHQQPNQAPGGPLPSKLPPQDFVNPPGPPPPSSHMAPPYSEHPPPPSEPHLPYVSQAWCTCVCIYDSLSVYSLLLEDMQEANSHLHYLTVSTQYTYTVQGMYTYVHNIPLL